MANVPASPTPAKAGTVASNSGGTVENVPSDTTLGGGVQTQAGPSLDELETRKDGTLRVSSQREVLASAPSRGTAFSYNEVTDTTTVTTSVDGATVTFEQSGDTRPKADSKDATDSAIAAFDRAQAAKE